MLPLPNLLQSGLTNNPALPGHTKGRAAAEAIAPVSFETGEFSALLASFTENDAIVSQPVPVCADGAEGDIERAPYAENDIGDDFEITDCNVADGKILPLLLPVNGPVAEENRPTPAAPHLPPRNTQAAQFTPPASHTAASVSGRITPIPSEDLATAPAFLASADPTPEMHPLRIAPATIDHPSPMISVPKMELCDANNAPESELTAGGPEPERSPAKQRPSATLETAKQTTTVPLTTAPTTDQLPVSAGFEHSTAQSRHPSTQSVAPKLPPDAGREIENLVDRIVQARSLAQTDVVKTSLSHADFGRVAVHFDAGGKQISATLTSVDPAFVPAVHSAAALVADPLQDGGQPRPETGTGSTSPQQGQASPDHGRNSGEQNRPDRTTHRFEPRPASRENDAEAHSRKAADRRGDLFA